MAVQPVHEALTSDYVKELIKLKARQLRRRPEFRRAELAEIQQDLAVQVLRQAHHFDPSRGCVTTFIATVVDSAAAMMCRDRGRLKRAGNQRLQSLEGSAVQHDGQDATLLDLLTEPDLRRRQGIRSAPESHRRDLGMDLDEMLAGLTPPLRGICQRLMDGQNEASIARNLGVSRRQVRKAIGQVREQFRQAGLGGLGGI